MHLRTQKKKKNINNSTIYGLVQLAKKSHPPTGRLFKVTRFFCTFERLKDVIKKSSSV